jgi:hypothetical protein
MAIAQKKVVVRRFEGPPVWGYLPASGFAAGGAVELMEVDGRIKLLAFSEVKLIAYVKDFNLDDAVEPERIGRKTFPARPRGDGLWVRLGFTDGDSLEGLAAVDMGLMDALIAERGLFVTPPDAKSNAQRVFVPRAALRSLEVLGYVTAPSKKHAVKVEEQKQGGLFE